MTALKLDVAIVGGGPGGLAAAISLQRAVPGIALKVVYLCVYPCCMCVCVDACEWKDSPAPSLPGGRCGTQATPRSKLPPQVYERSASVAPRGAGLRLEVNGLKALEAIDPAAYADVQREAYQASGSVMMDAQG